MYHFSWKVRAWGIELVKAYPQMEMGEAFHDTLTSAAESLVEYISLDFDGISKTVAELLGGIEVPVDTNGFANDLVTFGDRDDVLTLLIHLGYLAYECLIEKIQKCILP